MTDTLERYGENPGDTLAANLAEIRQRIAAACGRSGRDISSVRLLPISKTVPVEIIRIAHGLGLNEFGENKVQEAKGKSGILVDLPIRWSVVGHLQTNKAKYLAKFASEFQALDSLKVAAALNERLVLEDRHLDVFVQVNTSGEETKFGLRNGDVRPFLEKLPVYPRLRPRGFMTLALFSNDTDRVRKCFVALRELRDALRDQTPAGLMDELSMGMSGDFETAIEEGATTVRIGQGIFGRRPGSDAHYWPGLIPQ